MKKRIEGRTIILHLDAKATLQTWLEELKAGGELLPTMTLFRSREGVSHSLSRVQAWLILEAPCAANGLTGQLGPTPCGKRLPIVSMRGWGGLGENPAGAGAQERQQHGQLSELP